jgi:hypothetical protein
LDQRETCSSWEGVAVAAIVESVALQTCFEAVALEIQWAVADIVAAVEKAASWKADQEPYLEADILVALACPDVVAASAAFQDAVAASVAYQVVQYQMGLLDSVAVAGQ